MTTVVRKRQFMQMDEIRMLNSYRDVFRRLCNDEDVIVVTDKVKDPEVLFGVYYKAFNVYLERGKLTLKCITEMDDDNSDYVIL